MPSDASALAFGDVVLVPFPFTDQTALKRRPAVVISAQDYNARSPDIILMPVTSQLRENARYGDVAVLNWQDAGLLKPSTIKPLIATIESALIVRRLGALGPDDAAAVRGLLATIIGQFSSPSAAEGGSSV